MQKRLPVGIEDFKEIIQNNYYYVDKTLLIKELLDKGAKVNLFTRPRRFGKTLNLNMLRYFFENTGNSKINKEHADLFQGLNISRQPEEYLSQQNNYPVISLSLKSAKQENWTLSYTMLLRQISKEYQRHQDILEGLSFVQKERFSMIMAEQGDMGIYLDAIAFLSECLFTYYKKKVVILIDEYDVPLENAYFTGFYQEMTGFIRSLFESALKSNECLEFAVITGCLRITKESIFTGLNNLKMVSILTESYGEFFGFLQNEVDKMLQEYSIQGVCSVVREWYDGYLFGGVEVYNPWSIINYIDSLTANPTALPQPYWSNTSSNSIVRRLIEKADISVRAEIEDLISGETIEKPVHEDITYEDIEVSQDNLWNFLFFTGYLKASQIFLQGEERYIAMAIPNAEVRYIYKNTVRTWFAETVQDEDLTDLYNALENGDEERLAEEISIQLQETISFYDYAENYYHGFLAGLLKNMRKYQILSNRESGMGRPDLILKTPSAKGNAVIIELKIAHSYQDMESSCKKALEQIMVQKYGDSIRSEGYHNIMAYGISFYKKDCLVKRQDLI